MLRVTLILLVATWALSLARLARIWRQPVRVAVARRARRFAA